MKDVLTFICRMTLCKIGIHKFRDVWDKFNEGNFYCRWCGKSHEEDYFN